jgi:hypothetical protein
VLPNKKATGMYSINKESKMKQGIKRAIAKLEKAKVDKNGLAFLDYFTISFFSSE